VDSNSLPRSFRCRPCLVNRCLLASTSSTLRCEENFCSWVHWSSQCQEVPCEVRHWKKWPGVRAYGSLGSEGIWHNGQEFRHASVWVKVVDISSKLIHALPMTQRMWCFMDFIPASQRPPKCGEWGGIKCQRSPSVVIKLFLLERCQSWAFLLIRRACY
jgi:hypothetical protein